MTRRRSSRYRRRRIRLWPSERMLVILGATLYVVGLLGGFSLLAMSARSAIVLLALGGGLLMAALFSLIF